MSKHISKNGESVKKYQTGWNLPTESIDNVAYDIIFLVLKENKDEFVEINTLIRGIEKKSKQQSIDRDNDKSKKVVKEKNNTKLKTSDLSKKSTKDEKKNY